MSITQDMLALAREQQWLELEQLESRRRILLEYYFSQPVEEESIREGIHHIMQIDKQIYGMSKAAMDVLSAEMDKLSKNKQAVSEYNKNAR